MGIGLQCAALCNEKPSDPCFSLGFGSDGRIFIHCDFASVIFSINQAGVRREFEIVLHTDVFF